MSTNRKFFIALSCIALAAAAVPSAYASAVQEAPATRSGQKDFDFEIGTWTTRVKVLRNPLTGEAPNWAEYEGISVVRPLLDGRANFVELSVRGSAGQIEGGALRLYNPKTRQWNINYAGLSNGMLTPPVYGSFDGHGRGTFLGQDMLNGRAILVRFVITQKGANEAHFEQSYSADGGATWETNWIAVDTRKD